MNNFGDISFIFENFHKITSARISLHDTEFNEIFAYPKTLLPFCAALQKSRSVSYKCRQCDIAAFEQVKRTGKTYTYFCHSFLMETVAPIYHYGVLSGYIMMGQITDKSFKHKQLIRENADAYFESGEQLSAALLQIPEVPGDMLDAYVNILTVISEYLTSSSFVTPRSEERAQSIKSYINIHFTENVTVNRLCGEFKCSRATVMNCFKDKFGITVNEYIIQKRLSLACEKLTGSNDDIKKIAAECGFCDQNYFSRLFKKHFGTTPTQYKKSGGIKNAEI